MRGSVGGDCQEPQGPTILSPNQVLRTKSGGGQGIQIVEMTAACFSRSAVETMQTGR